MNYESMTKAELIERLKNQEALMQESEQKKSHIYLDQKLTLEKDVPGKSRDWLEFSPVCTKVVDLDFNLRYMSSSGIKSLKIENIFEYYGQPYPFNFFPDSSKKAMIENLKKVKETSEVICQEVLLVDLDGNELWFQATIVPVNNDQGFIDYFVVVSVDITALKNAEKEKLQIQKGVVLNAEWALRDSEQRLGLLIDQVDFQLWSVDNNLKFTQSIGGGLEKLGLKPNEVIGISLYEFFQTDSPEFESIKWHLEALTGKCVDFETEWEGMHYETHLSPQRDSLGNIIVYGLHILLYVLIYIQTGSLIYPLALAAGLLGHPIQGIFVNYFGHIGNRFGGYRNFETDDQSCNNPIVALCIFGEGYQNNHHHDSSAVNFAMAKGEFDFGYQVCRLLRFFKLAHF